MRLTLLSIAMIFATYLSAQSDTLFFKLDDVYQTNWVETDRAQADFYRPVPFQTIGELYLLKDI